MRKAAINTVLLIATVAVVQLAYAQSLGTRGDPRGEYQRVGPFSIQTSPVTRTDWAEAAAICALKGEARLCRPAEWIAACRVRAIQPGGAPEWVDQISPEEGFGKSEGGFRALAIFPNCDRGVWLPVGKELLPVRCCRDGIGRF